MKIAKLERFRPVLHFSPKQNWMNDPNGLVFFKGEYHLFFQHNPNDSIWGPMHWGHAVSKDLIKWEELDIALYPDELGTIFSGSAVIDWYNTSGFFPEEPGMVAIFTHHLDNNDRTPPIQTQSLAYSHDQGRTWIKYQGNPVLTHPSKIDFRDPKVFWLEEQAKWIMVLATGQTVSLYSSSNLKEWHFESEFGEGIGCHDGVWECPDLFELTVENKDEKKWVLIVSIGDNLKYDHGSRTQYFLGSFDGSAFKADDWDIRWLDFGKDNYAGVSFSDIPEEDGRRLYLGWMSNWRYANEVPTEGWRSQMTLPRSLSLRDEKAGLKLIQTPVNTLERYFKRTKNISESVVRGDVEYKLEGIETSLHIQLNIENLNAKQYGVVIYHTSNQFTTITINAIDNYLRLDRNNSGEVGFSNNFLISQELNLEETSDINLLIIVDTSSIELFINEGGYALTSLIYPDKVSEKISVFSRDGEIKLTDSYISTPNNEEV
ncbi:glycoside hydrolase family 32 protein [Bacillus sp. SD088]|uniref:glycoside hydrolase family 32 protein n=1 Tax=Bacillus sp. SD088 TaxID=2782012 RepID=UPI001A978DE0|nr:glycoside hydrolase family 32 protein [Bacillus sp. SD088]MBO0994916.1 glycoside hydrolase family 32 protein [Bacillus sp. SD088]